jgi:Uma2 family endonuclease
MSTATQTEPMTLPSPAGVYRLTVDQYDRMVGQGRLSEHEPVELLAGVLVRKMPKNPDHVWAVSEIDEVLTACRTEAWHIRKEDPVRIPDYDEPEPDLAVVRGTRVSLRGRHPGPQDLALVVEVGSSSLDDDRGVRLERYALAGIPVYWIVNLPGGVVEVYTEPDQVNASYKRRADYARGQLVPVIIDGQEVVLIPVASLLLSTPDGGA